MNGMGNERIAEEYDFQIKDYKQQRKFNADAASKSGTAHLMISQPTFSSLFISFIVFFTSLVSVFVIDCTVIGAFPPTVTGPS